MNFTTIRSTTALALLVLLLVGVPGLGLSIKHFGHRDLNDWLHAFVLVQTVLLAACAIYGPGSLLVRTPFLVAWSLALGFLLATLNLISAAGKAAIAAGLILVLAGTLAPLVIFALHRWNCQATLIIGNFSGRYASRQRHQLSLQMLMIVTAAFAVSGVVARAAITAPADPYGTEHDILVLHMWLGFFPCFTAATALLVVFRPSWKMVLVSCFLAALALVEPLLFAFAAPFILTDKTYLPSLTTWDYLQAAWLQTIIYNGQAVVATVIYALLARAAGFRMIVPDQSNDKKPNPAGQPATDAGCVQA